MRLTVSEVDVENDLVFGALDVTDRVLALGDDVAEATWARTTLNLDVGTNKGTIQSQYTRRRVRLTTCRTSRGSPKRLQSA